MKIKKAVTLISACLVGPLVSLVSAQTSTPPAPPPQAAGYELMFYDDFTNLNLSPDGNGLYSWYEGMPWDKQPTNFDASTNNSVLTLSWDRGQKVAETTIKGCSHDGSHCPGYRYGYFEARMKWDVSTGAWPAFWMLPVQSIGNKTEFGELDIFEGQGDPRNQYTYYGTIHDWKYVHGLPTDVANNCCMNYAKIPGVDFSQFHKYGLLWVPGSVTWYFDDNPIISAPTYTIYDQQNFFLMLGSQEGANWSFGNLNGVTANALSLYVDWVRVWQPYTN